ncbi:MAG TPA: hypothetical protein VEA17_13495 [Bordetella sp.]|nr:hypothetical protein [Bordetella sp.]
MARLAGESPASRPRAIVFAHDHLAIGTLPCAPALGCRSRKLVVRGTSKIAMQGKVL